MGLFDGLRKEKILQGAIVHNIMNERGIVVNVTDSHVIVNMNNGLGDGAIRYYNTNDAGESLTVIGYIGDTPEKSDAGISEVCQGMHIMYYGYPCTVTQIKSDHAHLQFDSDVFEIPGKCGTDGWYPVNKILHCLDVWEIVSSEQDVTDDVMKIFNMIPALERTDDPIEKQVEYFKYQHADLFEQGGAVVGLSDNDVRAEHAIDQGSIINMNGTRAIVTAIDSDVAYVVPNGNDSGKLRADIVRVVLVDGKFPDTFKCLGKVGIDRAPLYEDEEKSDEARRVYQFKSGTRVAYYGWPCTVTVSESRVTTNLHFDKGVFGGATCPYEGVHPSVRELLTDYDIWEIGYLNPESMYDVDKMGDMGLNELLYDRQTSEFLKIPTKGVQSAEVKSPGEAFSSVFQKKGFRKLLQYDNTTIYICEDTNVYYIGDSKGTIMAPFLSQKGNPIVYSGGHVVDSKTGMPLDVSNDLQQVYDMIPALERTNEPVEVQVMMFKQRHPDLFK